MTLRTPSAEGTVRSDVSDSAGGDRCLDPDLSAADAGAVYAEELRRWRQHRAFSIRALAKQMAYDRTYLSHIEASRLPPTEPFTRRAEAILDCGGALWASWETWKRTQPARPGRRRDSELPTVLNAVLDRLDAMQAHLNELSRLYADAVGAGFAPRPANAESPPRPPESSATGLPPNVSWIDRRALVGGQP